MRVIVSSFLFNRKTTSNLGWAFIGLIDGGRIKEYAVDGADITRIGPNGCVMGSWCEAYKDDHAAVEDWRAAFAVPREKAVPSMREHAYSLEEQLERHGPDGAMVSLSLTEGVFLRSSTWARWQLGIPLPADRRGQTAVPQAKWVYTALQQHSQLTMATLRRCGVGPPRP